MAALATGPHAATGVVHVYGCPEPELSLSLPAEREAASYQQPVYLHPLAG